MSLELQEFTLQIADQPRRIGLLELTTTSPDSPFVLHHQNLQELLDLCNTLQETRQNAPELLVLRGQGTVFCAGADLNYADQITSPLAAQDFAQAGQDALQALQNLPIPTVAWLNGSALGGGLELALHCTLRLANDLPRTTLGLPEVALGLIPGWGGAHLLPGLVGLKAATDLMFDRALAGARGWNVKEALNYGLLDSVVPCGTALSEVVAWAFEQRSAGAATTHNRNVDTGGIAQEPWSQTVARLRHRAERISPSTPAALELVEHLEGQQTHLDGPSKLDAWARKDQVERLTRLITGAQFARARYAMQVTGQVKAPRGAHTSIQKVGVVGAGLMAAQIVALTVSKLRLPVVMMDLDEQRVRAGAQRVEELMTKTSSGEVGSLAELVFTTTSVEDFADCDLVIEAVTEVLEVKQQIFEQLERVLSPEAVLASNTSALSLTAMASQLQYPGRVVGLHFFNPVVRMPLVEVVRQELSSDDTVVQAMSFAHALGKSAVVCADRPGFIVNRLLLLLLSRVLRACEQGTDLESANAALDSLNLPMRPLELLDLVGPAVAQHVLVTLHRELGERFALSPGLAEIVKQAIPLTLRQPDGQANQVNPQAAALFGSQTTSPGPMPQPEILQDVLTHLAGEVQLMLHDGAALRLGNLDAALILGAGWPLALGGLSPYLEHTGHLA